jgi:V8-like Glu-specific endopeptidase
VTTYSGWTSLGLWGYDMAVVHLETPRTTLPTAFTVLESDTYSARIMNTAGYPGDKPRGTMWRAACRMEDPTPGDLVGSTGVPI